MFELILKKSSDLAEDPNIKSSEVMKDLCKFKIAASGQTKYR
jgi:hypothetical protein